MSLKLFFDLELFRAVHYAMSYLHTYDGLVKLSKYGTAAAEVVVVKVYRKLLSSLKSK